MQLGLALLQLKYDLLSEANQALVILVRLITSHIGKSSFMLSIQLASGGGGASCLGNVAL